jgi:hypothetical protein
MGITMKKIAFLLAVVVLTFALSNYKQAEQSIAKERQSARLAEIHSKRILAEGKAKIEERKKREAEELKARQEAEAKAEAVRVAAQQSQAPATPSSNTGVSCDQAIDQVFPVALRDGAKTVRTYENRSANPSAVGSVNGDGSRDYGCFQINNKAHPQFFATRDWSNPVDSATYALQIYQERARIQGNGWRAWYAVQGILW